ncbi:MAG: hypothetical protein R2780_12230 [Crocinitomicaceae bacterium]|nr:hypothetical protein [Crocinitomicaceae bacterium]
MYRSIFLFAAMIVFLGCRKDNEIDLPEPPPTNCSYDVWSTANDYIIFGDTTGMRTFTVSDDTIFLDYGSYSNFGAWCPMEEDIQLKCQYYSASMMAGTFDFVISNLTNVSFAQIEFGDTLFSYKDTTYHQNQGVTVETITNHGTCDGTESDHDTVGYVTDKLALFQSGEQLNISDFFSDQDNAIREGPIQMFTGGPDSISVDTIRVYQIYYTRRSCVDLSQSAHWYIGFKKPVNSYQKLGWVKFSAIQGAIVVHEVAIQK